MSKKITSIEIGKRNKERVNIYIDNDFAFSCSAELVYKYNIKKDSFIDEDIIKSIIEKDNIVKCKNSALRIVEKSYKTESEIREKLLLKEYDVDTINETVKFLKEYSFINDEKYANAYVKDRIKREGKNKIRYSLKKKGLSDDSIESAIRNYIDEESEEMVARNLALKKYNILIKRESDKLKLRQKLTRFLISKGYNYELSNRIVSSIIKGDIEFGGY